MTVKYVLQKVGLLSRQICDGNNLPVNKTHRRFYRDGQYRGGFHSQSVGCTDSIVVALKSWQFNCLASMNYSCKPATSYTGGHSHHQLNHESLSPFSFRQKNGYGVIRIIKHPEVNLRNQFTVSSSIVCILSAATTASKTIGQNI